MTYAIELLGISKSYGSVQALNNIHLTIKDGEFFSLLGPSGSGKTTCLKIIAGFEGSQEGHVKLFNEDVTLVPPYKRDLNTVFQDYALFPHMSVRSNIGYSLRIKKVKQNLFEKISSVGSKKIDENRLEQELIFYLEKQDITEEQVRLKAHLEYFAETIKNDFPNGKKLGFIAQEIGREINTIGSKSSDADMQKIIVQMKDELEKIKEQLLNIL